VANTPKKLYAGTPGTTSATLYTAPASTKTIVKSLVIGNTTTTAATITINFAGIGLVNAYSVAANDTVVIDLSLVLETTETITALQGTASALRLHISGVEVV
jgi:hypothetical protein